jgi:hypothetical protein
MPNLRVLKPGLGEPGKTIPVGVVVNPLLVGGGRYHGHVRLGVVEETDDPVTWGSDAARLGGPPADEDSARAENDRLRVRLAEFDGKLAGEAAARKAAEAELAKARHDLAAAEDLVKQLDAQCKVLQGIRTQQQIDAGTLQPADPALIPHVPPTKITP